jgi:CubicO group peptidase (beta-lactamase class C family)
VNAARAILARAIEDRIFPAAVAEVGDSVGVLWRDALGTLTFDTDAAAATETTPFDLASLTKPLATASLVMELVDRHALELNEPVARSFPEWRAVDREAVTVQDLLEHASGLPARLVDVPPSTRREFEHEICTIKLEYPPRTKSVYSDLGFILLGFLIGDRGGEPLPGLFDRMVRRVLGASEPGRDDRVLTFTPPAHRRVETAPTLPLPDDSRRGRLLAGEVHDNYAAALGGAAGHAGLFGDVSGVAALARLILRGARGDALVLPPFSSSLMTRALMRSTVPGSSRALGWDTMRPTSSCGTRMSPAAFGHVGFTGTSLWIDPPRDRYFVLLTNRACAGGDVAESREQMREVRRAFHDALASL